MQPDIATALSKFVSTGTEAAFTHLCEAARPVILSWLARRRRCPSIDAEDVCQETLLAVWKRYSSEGNVGQSRESERPTANEVTLRYLFVVAQRKEVEAREKTFEVGTSIRRRIRLVGDMWDVEAEAVAGSSVSTIVFEPAPAQRDVDARDLISELPAEMRQLLHDTLWEGKTTNEIATERDQSIDLVYRKRREALQRASETFKRIMDESWLSVATQVLSELEYTGHIPTASAGNLASALVRRMNLNPNGEVSMVDLHQIARHQNILVEEAHLCVEYLRNKLPALLKRYFVSAYDGSPVPANVVCNNLSKGVESIEWKNWAANVRVVWRTNANWYSWDAE